MSEVSILPQESIIYDFINIEDENSISTKTYKIKDERIVGFCDGIEALKQAIELILNTERYEYTIYSWNYGSELKEIIGQDKLIIESEFKRRIKEALLEDDRIKNVDNFEFNYEKDSALIKFTVFSIYGEFIESVVKKPIV
ncbi:DUF2634 domain-containing protein [Clostridium senegalense]|uniref:DUF2634 domain-containing protein n=1 Tax=Clostridium senegalense TaxID=1465809 RepID=UPI0002895688|nr:DUF2634 domain-containing protein [Clostridium senegalense]